MPDQSATALRTAFDELQRRIESRQMGDDPALKRALMDIYREVDATAAQLTQLKDDIKRLVEQWKTQRDTTPAMAPQFASARPIVHEDHLGASTFLEKGWSKISFGDYEGAEELLQHALALAPTSTEGQSLLGWAQMLQDKLDVALMNFHQVLRREPSNSLARINVGYICLKKGIFGEAIEHLSKALRQDDDARAKLYANFYLGLVYLEREMYEDAQIFFERSITLGPNLVEAYLELGHALWLAGKQDDARAVWTQGANVNQFNPWSKRCQEVIDLLEQGGTPRRAWLSRGE
ncbi:MAG TPA: tetratricopeptide repeat protein [Gemmatimonadaceae bacterium]|jgi:tetratricopeptide (TPR) repeat protein|nr:tetratricopeptide repeat protein [Gemmatimonadaceae bacterium]